MNGVGAIVMAAGLGKRMRSKRAKVLHAVAGRPMVLYAVELAKQFADEGIAVVVGHQADQVKAVLEAHCASQADPPVRRSVHRETGLTASIQNPASKTPRILIAEQKE